MKKKGFVIGGLIILAGAAGAGGWYYYKENYGDSAAASGEVAYVTKISTLLCSLYAYGLCDVQYNRE